MAITIPNPNLTKTELSKNDKKIGFKLPLESGTTHGNFESTILTIDAVKEDIISLLKTEKGERVMQPRLGLGLKKNLFENFTPELKLTTSKISCADLVEKIKSIGYFPSSDHLIFIDGIRVEYPDGFGLARPSNTTPVVVLRFEGSNERTLTRIQEEFRETLLKIDPDLNLPF